VNLISVKNAITSKIGRQLLTGQKHMPTILFGAGVVGVVATVVIACRATLKVHEILDDAQDELEEAESLEHSDSDRQKSVARIYFKAGGRIAALYAPAVLVGAVSIGALTGAHISLHKRNLALTAAYAALDKGFREYRDRVVKELGEGKDKEFRYGAQDATIVEDGPEGPKTLDVKRLGSDDPSIYARWFDDSCTAWQRQPEYNRIFLKCQQNYANDLLNSRGHVFLNEVYDSLGMKRSREGSVVGWVKGNGDGFVDFGIFNPDSHTNRDYVNGWQDRVLLDFNVDGVIYDKI
jgi:hypothetical protein